MPCKHGGHNVLSCFDTWGNGGSTAKTLSFEHSGLLCCDPWSDSPGWLLIAPATLHQTDGSRGSLTWVQGKCNDMDAPQALCLLPRLSPLYELFLLCKDLSVSVLPLCPFLILLLLSLTNSSIHQNVCVWMHHAICLDIKDRDLQCLQHALHGACVSLQRKLPSSVPFLPRRPLR